MDKINKVEEIQMTSKESAKRIGKIIMLISFIACFMAIGICGWAVEGRKINPEHLKFKGIYKKLFESGGLRKAEPGPELDLVLIKGEVLSAGVTYREEGVIGESFLYVHNQGEIGDDVIVCFVPGVVHDIFKVALSSDYLIQAWGVEIAPPEEYEEVTTKAFIVFAARVLHPDVPSEFSDLEISLDFLFGGPVEIK